MLEIIKKKNAYYQGKNKLQLRFFEENHEYLLGFEENGEFNAVKTLTSVTTAMQNNNLGADYSNVSQEILKRAAERGNAVHEELENYIKHGELGFTQELNDFINLIMAENIKPLNSEFLVYNDIIAGTVDIDGTIDGETFLGDFKTTAKLHTQAVSWQLSIYEYLSGKIYDKLLCFHFTKNGLKKVEIPRVDRKKVEELFDKVRNNETYNPSEIILKDNISDQLFLIQTELKSLDTQKKELELKEKEYKAIILKQMQETHTKSIENEYFKITYVNEIERKTIDTTKLRAEMPEIAEKYQKITVTAPSLRITLRN